MLGVLHMPIAAPPCHESHYSVAKIITLLIAAAILMGTLIPVSQLPEADGGDKVAHLIAFALLALPLNLAGHPRWLLLNTGFVLFGGAIEFIQPFVDRHGEWLDLGADMVGVAAGLLVARGLHLLLGRGD